MAVADEFERFVTEVEPRLRRALVAAYGVERGREAVAEALGYAWQHWARVRTMANPAGYLFRVGQSRTRSRKRPVVLPDAPTDGTPWIEPSLVGCLRAMSERQRLTVVLVHGFGWTLREVADTTGISVSSVQTHLERGLRVLRDAMGVEPHV